MTRISRASARVVYGGVIKYLKLMQCSPLIDMKNYYNRGSFQVFDFINNIIENTHFSLFPQ